MRDFEIIEPENELGGLLLVFAVSLLKQIAAKHLLAFQYCNTNKER